MLVVLDSSDVFDEFAGHLTSALKPTARDGEVDEVVENHNPTVVFFHVRYGSDHCNPALEHSNVLEELRSAGKAVLIAGSHDTLVVGESEVWIRPFAEAILPFIATISAWSRNSCNGVVRV